MTYTIQMDSVSLKKFKINVTAFYRWYNNIPPPFLSLLLNGPPYFFAEYLQLTIDISPPQKQIFESRGV